jgi:hypothetical protein
MLNVSEKAAELACGGLLVLCVAAAAEVAASMTTFLLSVSACTDPALGTCCAGIVATLNNLRG